VVLIHQRHRQTDGQTDRQTTCDRNAALCAIVHRAVKIIMAALMLSRHDRAYVSKFQFTFQPAREQRPNVSDVVCIFGGKLFHVNGPATKKLRLQVVLVRDTTMSA